MFLKFCLQVIGYVIFKRQILSIFNSFLFNYCIALVQFSVMFIFVYCIRQQKTDIVCFKFGKEFEPVLTVSIGLTLTSQFRVCYFD